MIDKTRHNVLIACAAPPPLESPPTPNFADPVAARGPAPPKGKKRKKERKKERKRERGKKGYALPALAARLDIATSPPYILGLPACFHLATSPRHSLVS